MKTLLIVTSADPFTSHRVAEAVRVAAGLQQSGSLAVTLILEGRARECLSPEAAEGIDGSTFSPHLALFRESGGIVQKELSPDVSPGETLIRL